MLLLAGLAACVIADYWAYPWLAGEGGRSLNAGENGLWLRYWWYFGQRSEGDLERLAAELPRDQIRYAYFHVRSVAADGTLHFHYPAQARRLTAFLHQRAPSVKLLAWVYVGNRRGQGEVELASVAVRRAMVREALWLVRECGFDGVQWDYEVCPDGDPQFLRLMRETRQALPESAILSAAVPMWGPGPIRQAGWGWSEGYFQQVAGTCNQLAVMCYDSGMVMPRWYVWLVREQAVRVPRAVRAGSSRCQVLFGVPTYEDGTRSHNPRAENIRLALKGLREGLANAGPLGPVGVAVFAEYTTDAEEWATYRRMWLGEGAGRGRNPVSPAAQ